jgi:hypothetical protein
MEKRSWLRKIREWEYWPFHWLYGPIYLIFIGYVVRSGFRFFFSASNPTIKNGGFVLESKKAVYDILPEGTYPPTLYFEPGVAVNSLVQEIQHAALPYPLVLKPDIGGRGRAVVIIRHQDELNYYVPKYDMPFLVQPWVHYKEEVGIFYVKNPGEKEGKITGIVGKAFGSVTGDGSSTIQQLILADERLKLYMESLAEQLAGKLHDVLPAGKKEMLVPFGNHARGTAFFNWSHMADDRLNKWANDLVARIDGFYFGRLDIRYDDWEALLNDNAYSIIELNGAGSEPTHIYDPSQSVLYAWGEIIRHWHLLWKISHANKKLGHRYMSFREGTQMLKENAAYEKALDNLHQKLLAPPPVNAERLNVVS